MNRREIIKNSALFFGVAMTGGALATAISSCKVDKSLDWAPVFFNEEQAMGISELAETILPKTETPGAKEMMVDRFLDVFVKKQFTKEAQDKFLSGLNSFMSEFEKKYNKTFTDADQDARTAYLMDLEKESVGFRPTVWGMPVGAERDITFYRQAKSMILWGYFSSEKIGEEELNYLPIPGKYRGCVPLSEIPNGKAWSL